MTRKTGTYLIYHVDEYLCILEGEAADRFILVLPRKGGIDQGGEFTENGLASIYASGGYNYAEGKEGSESDKQSMRHEVGEGEAGDVPLPGEETVGS